MGWAVARRFAVSHTVVIGDRQPPEQELARGMHWMPVDVTDFAQCEELINHAQSFGALEALVNSAAITAPACPILELSSTEWRRILDVNLTGSFHIAKAAIPALHRNRGAAVLIASRAARVGYAALKDRKSTRLNSSHQCPPRITH